MLLYVILGQVHAIFHMPSLDRYISLRISHFRIRTKLSPVGASLWEPSLSFLPRRTISFSRYRAHELFAAFLVSFASGSGCFLPPCAHCSGVGRIASCVLSFLSRRKIRLSHYRARKLFSAILARFASGSGFSCSSMVPCWCVGWIASCVRWLSSWVWYIAESC